MLTLQNLLMLMPCMVQIHLNLLIVKLCISFLKSSSAIDNMRGLLDQRTNFLGYTQAMWRDLLVDLDEKPFQATQLMKWIHHRLVDDFAEMTDIS